MPGAGTDPNPKTIFQTASCLGYPARVHWNKVTLVGVGLLGGSLGLALRRHKLAREIAGYVRREASIRECARKGVVDYATTDLLAAVSGADLVVLCTPIIQMKPLVARMLPALKRGAIVTDVGSVKESVVRELEQLTAKAGAHFVGSHPMAGTEKSGVLAARPNLFECAVCVITPTSGSNRTAVNKTRRLWKSVGCRVLHLSPSEHDAMASRASHLPHIVAATLATTVLDRKSPPAQSALCATGFRDTTRIASGSPEMWRDIALTNRREIGRALKEFVRQLGNFQRALDRNDAQSISRFFATAKQRRDSWCACCVSPTPE